MDVTAVAIDGDTRAKSIRLEPGVRVLKSWSGNLDDQMSVKVHDEAKRRMPDRGSDKDSLKSPARMIS